VPLESAHDPDRVLGQLVWQTAFREHPYRFPIIGHEAVFRRTTRDDLVTFCRRNYVTDNLVVVIVGDVRREEAMQAVRETVGALERRTRRTIVLPAESRQSASRTIRQTGPYQVTRMGCVWQTVPLNHPDAAALEVLAVVTGQGDSSRLTLEYRDRLRWVHEISAWSYTPREAGLFGISAVFDPERETDLVNVLQAEVERWTTNPFPDESIEKARRQLAVRELAELQTMKGQAGQYASGEFYAGSPTFSETWIRRLMAVTPESVMAVAGRYLQVERRTLAVLAPQAPASTNVPAASAVRSPRPQRRVLANGIPLIVQQDSRLPFVNICVAFRGGLLQETTTNSGITSLMAELLTRGTDSLTAETLAREIETMGATLEPFSGWNSFGLRGRCLSSDVKRFMGYVSDCLTRAAFPQTELDQHKAIQIAEIRKQDEDPIAVAQRALGPLLFNDHPYGRPLLGSVGSVEALTRDAVIRHYQTLTVTGNVAVAIFGDLDPDTAEWLGTRAFNDLPAGATPVDQPVSRPGQPGRIEQPMPREQAIVLMGFPGITLQDPRYEAVRILQDSLSGLSSDLAMEVRETRGLAYFVGAYQRPGLQPGSFVLYAGTRPDAVATVESLMRKELDRIAREGIRTDEFERARNRLIAAHEMALQNPLDTAMNCALNELYGLGFDFGLGTADRLRALTPETLQTTAASLFTQTVSGVSIVIPVDPAPTTDQGAPSP